MWKDGNSKGQSSKLAWPYNYLEVCSSCCNRSFVVILHGHCVIDSPRASEGLEQCRKCYTVNDISFDPNRYASYTPSGATNDIRVFP
jgi:hypothetical protein